MNSRLLERFGSACVQHYNFAHHSVRIRTTTPHIFCRDNETKIAETVFDSAEAALTTSIEIDFASAWSDARVFQMRLKSDDPALSSARSVMRLAIKVAREGTRTARSVDC